MPKLHHISPVLEQLHWLPIKRRIQYMIILQTFRALTGNGPAYIKELIQERIPPRALRFSHMKQLCVPKTKLKSYGQRTFRWASATLWNNLSPTIRAIDNLNPFKPALKTHLYMAEYCTALDNWFYYWCKLFLVIILYINVSPSHVFLTFTLYWYCYYLCRRYTM